MLVRLAIHEDAGEVLAAVLTAAALLARAFLRLLAPFLARAFTSLTRLRCAVALCSVRPILLLLAIRQYTRHLKRLAFSSSNAIKTRTQSGDGKPVVTRSLDSSPTTVPWTGSRATPRGCPLDR